MDETTEFLNSLVGDTFTIEKIEGQPDGVYGWKMIRKLQGDGTLIGPDLLPVALIKKDFKGIRIMNNVPDVIEVLKMIIDGVHQKYTIVLEMPKE